MKEKNYNTTENSYMTDQSWKKYFDYSSTWNIFSTSGIQVFEILFSTLSIQVLEILFSTSSIQALEILFSTSSI